MVPMKRSLTTMPLVLAAVLAACAPISQEAKDELKKPVDCRTAEGDLRVLKQEKASVAKQVLDGVTSMVPAGMIIGAVRGDAGDKLTVATGDYNKAIDAKIAKIKSTCGL